MTRQGGPPPLPAEALKLRGSYVPKHRRNPPKPPEAEAGIAAPDYLGFAAKREWRRITPILQRLKLLTEADVPMAAEWCQAVSEAQIAAAEIDQLMRRRRITGDRSSNDVRQALKHWQLVRHRAVERMRQISSRFGFTPADRVDLDVGAGIPDAGSATKPQDWGSLIG